MRRLIQLLLCAGLAVSQLTAREVIVCTTLTTLHDGRACTTTDIRSALSNAQPGDRIILRAGDVFNVGGLVLPKSNGADWITIESSRASELRSGYRVTPKDIAAGRLATIAFDATTYLETYPRRIPADLSQSASADPVTDTIVWAGHGLSNGDEIAFLMGPRRSPLLCYGDNLPAYSGNPCAGLAGYIYDRFAPAVKWTNDMPVRVYGRALPPELAVGGTYYVRDASSQGSGMKFRLAATAGGPPIDFSGPADGLYIVVTAYPLENHKSYFVRDVTANTFRVSETPDGPAVDIVFGGMTISFSKVEKTQHIILRGLELRPQSGKFLYYVGFFGQFAYSNKSLPTNIIIDHCYWHGLFGEPGPYYGIAISGDGFLVRDSRCEEMKGTFDTHCILHLTSNGQAVIENNHLSATGESYMAGGAHPAIQGILPQNVVFRRNYFTKPLYWWFGVSWSTAGLSNAFRLTQRYSNSTCDQVASALPGSQCFGYTKDGQRAVLTQDNVFGSISGSGVIYFGLANNSSWIARYTSGVTFTCPPEFTCSNDGASVSWPQDAVLYGIAKIASGSITFDTTDKVVTRYITKNHLELKYGQYYQIEGNVFENIWFDLNGQYQALTFHPQATSVTTEPLAYWIKTADTVSQHNLFRNVLVPMSATGFSFLIGRDEAFLFGLGGRHIFRNNLAVNTNSASNGPADHSWIQACMKSTASDVVIDHNTFVATEGFLEASTSRPASFHLRNNVVIPTNRSGVWPKVFGDGAYDGGFYTLLRVKPNFAGSTMQRNILMNRNGRVYNTSRGTEYPGSPDTTYLIQANDPGRDPTLIFQTWNESNPLDANLRLQASAVSAYPSVDGKAIGADIDEIESLIGPKGADVVAGIPTFAERSSRQLEIARDALSIRYTPLSPAPCRIQVWSNSNYAGSPVADVSDASVATTNGRKSILITGLNPATDYYAKRSCDQYLDVFAFRTLD